MRNAICSLIGLLLPVLSVWGQDTAIDWKPLQWRANLNSPDPEVRRQAVAAVNSLASAARDAASALGSALRDPDVRVRFQAADALNRLGPLSEPALPALMQAIDDEDANVRVKVINALATMRPFSRPAIPKLLLALNDDVKLVRISAMAAIGALGRDAKAAVPSLIDALREKDPPKNPKDPHTIPCVAATALGNIGPDAAPAVPALLEALRSEHLALRGAVLDSLGKIRAGDEQVIRTLVKIVDEEPHWGVRRGAATALGQIGPEANKAIPSLLRLLDLSEEIQDSERRQQIVFLRVAAADALGRMEGFAKEKAVPALIQVLQDKKASSYVRQKAATALGNLGPVVAKDAIPALVEIAVDQASNSVHPQARTALASMGKTPVPLLVDLFKRGGAQTRTDVLAVFWEMGPAAVDAVPVLTEVAESSDPLASQVAQTLRRIQKRKK
jgi:HEAT repeat protein